MEISFDNAVDLQEQLGKNFEQISCSKLVSTLQTYTIYASWLALMVAVVFFVLSFFAIEDDVEPMRLVVVAALFGSIALVKVANLIFERNRKKYIQKIREENAGEVCISIDETGITDKCDDINTKVSWNRVSEIIALKDSFYILYGGHVIYIPFSCFDCKENLDRFAVTIEEYSKKHIRKISFEHVEEFIKEYKSKPVG